MHTFTLSIFALFPLFITRILSNPTSPRHILSPRTNFPGCISSTGDSVSCSCACETGFTTYSNAPNEVGQYVGCSAEDATYSPVGCLTCAQNTGIAGEEICESYANCAFDWTGDTPNGCYCWYCSSDCVDDPNGPVVQVCNANTVGMLQSGQLSS